MWWALWGLLLVSNLLTFLLAPKGRAWLRRLRERVAFFPRGRLGTREKDTDGAWWGTLREPIAIAHAGGGIGRFVYTNSKEAIEASLQRGMRVIEVDVCFTRDGHPVLSHDFEPDGEQPFGCMGEKPTLEQFLAQQVNGCLTPLSFEWLLCESNKWGGVVVFVDSKQGEACRLAEWLGNHSEFPVPRHWVFQVTSTREVQAFRAIGVPSGRLHFNAELPVAQHAIPWMLRNGIRSVSLNVRQVQTASGLAPFKEAGIHSFVWTVNHASTKERVVAAGVDGYFTDWLM